MCRSQSVTAPLWSESGSVTESHAAGDVVTPDVSGESTESVVEVTAGEVYADESSVTAVDVHRVEADENGFTVQSTTRTDSKSMKSRLRLHVPPVTVVQLIVTLCSCVTALFFAVLHNFSESTDNADKTAVTEVVFLWDGDL